LAPTAPTTPQAHTAASAADVLKGIMASDFESAFPQDQRGSADPLEVFKSLHTKGYGSRLTNPNDPLSQALTAFAPDYFGPEAWDRAGHGPTALAPKRGFGGRTDNFGNPIYPIADWNNWLERMVRGWSAFPSGFTQVQRDFEKANELAAFIQAGGKLRAPQAPRLAPDQSLVATSR
jgi:hypothetical protein